MFLITTWGKLRERVRLGMQSRLLRLRIWMEVKQFKLRFRSVLSVRDISVALLQAILRERQFPTLLPGDDPTVDDTLFVAVCELCALNPKGVEAAFIEKNRAAIAKAKQDALADEEFRRVSVEFYELQILLEKLVRSAAPNTAPFVTAARNVGGEPRNLEVKDLREVEKSLRKRIGKIRSAIEERRAFKISIPTDVWGPALALGSSVFLVSGYFYTAYVLGSFGIDATHYFSLSDYLAASIENVRSAAFSAIAVVLGLLLGLVSRSRKTIRQLNAERRINDPAYSVGALVVTFATVVTYMLDQRDTFYNYAYLLLFVLSMELAPRVAGWFARPMPAMFAAVVLIIYSGSLALDAHKKVYKLMQEVAHPSTAPGAEFILAKEAPLDAKDAVLITANASYFFFFSRRTHAAVVIPKESVKSAVYPNSPNEAH